MLEVVCIVAEFMAIVLLGLVVYALLVYPHKGGT